jgi:FkbM family methyltransferase
MLNYILNSIKRKMARRFTRKYPVRIGDFQIPGIGNVRFANWENPLVKPKHLSGEQYHFFKRFLQEGDVAIDIGANIGFMTVPMAMAAGKTGTVLAFDPNPYVFEILTTNAGLNPDHTHIIPLNFAITEQEDDFYYNSSEASFNNGGISSEKQSRHGKFALSSKIKGVHLETYLDRNYPGLLESVKLIKIDTEGYDKEVIKSISSLIEKYKPLIITECFGKLDDQARFEQFDALHSKGYHMHYFSDFTDKATVVPILKKEDMLKWKHFDLYAFPAK